MPEYREACRSTIARQLPSRELVSELLPALCFDTSSTRKFGFWSGSQLLQSAGWQLLKSMWMWMRWWPMNRQLMPHRCRLPMPPSPCLRQRYQCGLPDHGRQIISSCESSCAAGGLQRTSYFLQLVSE